MTKYLERHAQKGFIGVVLVTLYFILNNVDNYFGLLSGLMIAKYSVLYLALGLTIYFAGLLFFKHRVRSGLYSTLIMSIFFFFGAYHDFIKTTALPTLLKSYTLNLILILLVLISFFLLIKYAGTRVIASWNNYISLVLIILVLWQVAVLGFYLSTKHEIKNELGDLNKTVSKDYIPCNSCKTPNIYFIVFDEFTSSRCLLEEFAYDNSPMDSFLLKNHFYIADNASSNYPYTFFSIPSTFDLGYLNHAKLQGPLTAEQRLMGIKSIYYSELTKILQRQGYKINNISGFDLQGYPTAGRKFFEDKPESILPDQTIAGRIRRDIWWNFISPTEIKQGVNLAYSDSSRKRNIHDFVSSFMQRLQTSLYHHDADNPSFIYCHIMLPHSPYYYNANGEFNDLDSLKKMDISRDKHYYLNQLIYTEKLLKNMVDTIMRATKGEDIVIIEGDHGFRNYDDSVSIKRVYQNLNCYYFPDQDYRSLYKNISPVNTFRVVLNKFFNQKYPILPDSSFYSPLRNQHF